MRWPIWMVTKRSLKSSSEMHRALLHSPPSSRMSQLVGLFQHCFALTQLIVPVSHIIRQGRCTLVATIQMYKILALNCLITAYSLSVQYLDGIKFGDYQVTINGMLMSVCFLCISRAQVRCMYPFRRLADVSCVVQPVEKLSRERPLGNIFNFYVLLSVLIQFALHIVSLVYITNLAHFYEP